MFLSRSGTRPYKKPVGNGLIFLATMKNMFYQGLPLRSKTGETYGVNTWISTPYFKASFPVRLTLLYRHRLHNCSEVRYRQLYIPLHWPPEFYEEIKIELPPKLIDRESSPAVLILSHQLPETQTRPAHETRTHSTGLYCEHSMCKESMSHHIMHYESTTTCADQTLLILAPWL